MIELIHIHLSVTSGRNMGFGILAKDTSVNDSRSWDQTSDLQIERWLTLPPSHCRPFHVSTRTDSKVISDICLIFLETVRTFNYLKLKIIENKSSCVEGFQIITAFYFFPGLNRPWQSSHQSSRFYISSSSPPSAHHLSLLACITHLQTHIHTERHT